MMGDYTWLTELIGNYAFPIGACVYLAMENREQRRTHAETTQKLSTVLNDNTLAITRLTDKLEEKLHDDID